MQILLSFIFEQQNYVQSVGCLYQQFNELFEKRSPNNSTIGFLWQCNNIITHVL